MEDDEVFLSQDYDAMTDYQVDAVRMYEYLMWRLGPYYKVEEDEAPYSMNPDHTYAHENDEALNLLASWMDFLSMDTERRVTLREALTLLTGAVK